MRGTVVALLLVASAIAGVQAIAANILQFERAVAYIAREMEELRFLASRARLPGNASAEARGQITSRIAKLDPIVNDADREAGAIRLQVKQQELNERWLNRANRASDLVDAYSRVTELDSLISEMANLKAEFCGAGDLYQYAGDCGSQGGFRRYGEPR